MRLTNQLAGITAVAAVALSLAVVLAACDDGDDEEPTPVPSATLPATQAASTPAATPATTVDPDVTPGPPIAIELSADPQQLVCDGEQQSSVTALVVDALNHPVADGTDVRFEVATLGTADPINTTTTAGLAATSVVALGSEVGVVVNVTAGEAAASIRIDCQ
jgi:hypothetical protein